jgi:general secretion pathway protein G
MAIPDRYAGRELFCTSCKARFTAPDPTPAPVLAEGDPGVLCPGCGRASPTGSTFCASCGASFLPHLGDSDAMRRPGLISLLAVLDVLGGGLGLLAGMALLLTARQDTSVAAGIGGVYLVLAAAQIATGIGLWRLRPWARTAQIVFAVIGLLGFPVGTIISALILYYLFRPGIKVLFSGKRSAELTPDERAAVAELSGSSVVTIVVVLVALVFACGLVSAIAIPNLLNAINRGRQKRTVVDMQTIAAALEKHRAQRGYYPQSLSSIDQAAQQVGPASGGGLPAADGWGTPYEVRSDAGGAHYVLTSLGRDQEIGPSPGGETNDFDADIVMEDGRFVQWPAGIGPP